MTDPTPDHGPRTIPPEEFHRVQQSEEFALLRGRFRLFAFPMTVAFLAWYLFYVLGSIFAKDLMMTSVAGNLTVGILLGLGQFLSTFLITALYIWHANKRIDPLAEKLREELEGTAR